MIRLDGCYSPAPGIYVQAEKRELPEGLLSGAEVLLVGSYSRPTEIAVINYLQEKVKALSAYKQRPASPEVISSWTPLETLLMDTFSHKIFKDLLQNDLVCNRFIRNQTPAVPDSTFPLPKYLSFEFGFLPATIVPPLRTPKSSDDYSRQWRALHTLFHDGPEFVSGLGISLSGSLSLPEDNLPKQDEVQILLNHQVTHSNTLAFTRLSSYQESSDLIHLLYEIFLSQPAQLGQLMDISPEILDQFSCIPISIYNKATKADIMNLVANQFMVDRLSPSSNHLDKDQTN